MIPSAWLQSVGQHRAVLSLAGALSTACGALDPVLACVSGLAGRLRLLDLSQPDQPLWIGALNTYGRDVQDFAIHGQHMLGVTADNPAQFLVWEIVRPEETEPIATLNLPAAAPRLSIYDQLVVVANTSNGCVVIDVSEPMHPNVVGHYSGNGLIVDVAASAGGVLLCESGFGVRILDVSTPTQPLVIGEIPLDPVPSCVAWMGQLACFGRSSPAAGVAWYDLANPSRPRLLGSWQSEVTVQQIALAPGRVVVASGIGGVQWLELPSFLRIDRAGEPTVRISWEGPSGAQLQRASSLNAADWQELTVPSWTRSILVPVAEASSCFRLIHR